MTNKVIIIGNLTADPDYSVSASGTPVCRFTVAVNRCFSGNQQEERTADFFRVTTFRKTADNCSAYLAKGRKVCVVGEVHINEYTDRDGNKRTGVDITASEVEFLSPKDDGKPAAKAEEQPSGGFVPINDDLPF